MERLWQVLLHDAYWYCFLFFLLSIAAEELLAPKRRWRNRDDCIVYGQREDSPTNIRNGRSSPPAPKRDDTPALAKWMRPGLRRWAGFAFYS